MTDSERYEELASKWLDGTITAAEKAEFSMWYQAHRNERLELPTSFAGNEEELRRRILAAVRQKTVRKDTSHGLRFRPRWLIAAASVLLVVSVGFYLFRDSQNLDPVPRLTQQDIEPGGNRATLTLADGRTIELSSEQSGIIVGNQITYFDGTGLLDSGDRNEYPKDTRTKRLDADALPLMAIATPKGGQYQITLPDGSNVWLNSASLLRYPPRFAKGRREVELVAGEAYFEVSRQPGANTAKVPFIVKTRNQEVEVLGTQFNINAYEDEAAIRTTLVEGRVRVGHLGISTENSQAKILAPGEQAVLTDTQIGVRNVDVAEFTAWKDGYFYFNDADIYTVMKQFSRWYDIAVRYEIKSHNDLFVGKIPRDVNLTAALNILENAGVNFELQDRLLVILPSSN